jgi:hypothetical protein
MDSIIPVWAQDLGSTFDLTLAYVGDRYSCILLDLAGLDIGGVQEVALVPGVGIVLFVAKGRIGEFALAKIRRRLPAERLIGAVLDAEPIAVA